MSDPSRSRGADRPWLGAYYFVALEPQALKRSLRLQLIWNDGNARKAPTSRVTIADDEAHRDAPNSETDHKLSGIDWVQ